MTNNTVSAICIDRLDVEQAARFLGVAPKSLRNMRYAGTGPASYKIGSRVWYDQRDLDIYVARCKAATLVAGA